MGVLRLSCLLQLLLLLSCSFFFLLSFSRKKYCLSSLLVSLLVTQPICCTLQTFLMRITIFLLPGIFKLSFLQSSFPTSEMSFLSTWLMIHHLHCKCKNSGGFLFSVYKSFLLLPKATTQTARKTCAENPIRLTIFSKVRKKQKGLLAGVGQQASPRAHVFLRMHKDDVQNALMKNALDVSCSSRTFTTRTY